MLHQQGQQPITRDPIGHLAGEFIKAGAGGLDGEGGLHSHNDSGIGARVKASRRAGFTPPIGVELDGVFVEGGSNGGVNPALRISTAF